jgi:3-phosphoshikimate 1-carboxyvinyltransferase
MLSTLPEIMDVGHAGTAFRFLTAFLAITNGSWVLTGSDRMKKRPIYPLVDALQQLGADIEYLESEGFPPLKINGKSLNGGEVTVDSSMSSQFMSALMMIGPKLKSGLTINTPGNIVSVSYIEMTKKLLRQSGAKLRSAELKIEIQNTNYDFGTIEVEKDWSAISFWYEIVLIQEIEHLLIRNVSENSIQGDAYVQELFKPFGIESKFDLEGLHLSYTSPATELPTKIDLNSMPDLTQPFIVAMAAIGHEIEITGIQHLRHKETDRAEALKTELAKFGAELLVSNSSLTLKKGITQNSQIAVKTYQDHRMAMAFAPLTLMYNGIEIENPEVVAKSYPDFWVQLEKLGFKFTMVS